MRISDWSSDVCSSDLHERDTWLCGPAAFMADIESHWAAQGISERLRLERFGAAPRKLESGEASEVRCARSERIFTTEAGEALLQAAERARLKPPLGPRLGIRTTLLLPKTHCPPTTPITPQ